MAKILQTQLPISSDETVTSDTFNRTMRVLELNLNAVDVDNTPQFNQNFLDKSNFRNGDLVWNTTLGKLQVFSEDSFKTVSYESVTDIATSPIEQQTSSLVGTSLLGSVQVIANGNITVEVGL
tara:strand:+ start:5661 stop:6029 length:369 start_codon:yes stop_codon:yes gene_type:complete